MYIIYTKDLISKWR